MSKEQTEKEQVDFNTQLVEAKLSEVVMNLKVEVPWEIYTAYCSCVHTELYEYLNHDYTLEQIIQMPKVYKAFTKQMLSDYQEVDWSDKAENLHYEVEGIASTLFAEELAEERARQAAEKAALERKKAEEYAASQAKLRAGMFESERYIEIADPKKHKIAIAILKAAGIIK